MNEDWNWMKMESIRDAGCSREEWERLRRPELKTMPRITWRDRLSGRRMFWRTLEIEQWARAEVERTRPPVCDRDSCYDGPDTVASRKNHGCIPDWNRP